MSNAARSGAHRIVVMRTGCTEERHHSVTNVLVNRTSISDDNAVDEGGIAGYQFADLFRIQRSRHCRRIAEISEEYGDLPALPPGGPLSCLGLDEAVILRSAIPASKRLR